MERCRKGNLGSFSRILWKRPPHQNFSNATWGATMLWSGEYLYPLQKFRIVNCSPRSRGLISRPCAKLDKSQKGGALPSCWPPVQTCASAAITCTQWSQAVCRLYLSSLRLLPRGRELLIWTVFRAQGSSLLPPQLPSLSRGQSILQVKHPLKSLRSDAT